MILFVSALVLGLVLAVASAIGMAVSGLWRQARGWRSLVLVLGPAVDGVIVWALLSMLTISPLHAWAGGVLMAVVSYTYLQPMLLPQRLVVWRLAKEHVLRRPRQAALLVAGLVVASSIITSSMVVGDALDATVEQEVEATWGATDVVLSGFDQRTGLRVAYSEAMADRIWNGIQTHPDLSEQVVGRQHGWVDTVSLTPVEGPGEPTVAWFARNASIDAAGPWSSLGDGAYRFDDLRRANDGASVLQVALNTVASDSLGADVGDTLRMGYHRTSESGERVRDTVTVEVTAVVATTGQGALGGTRSPAMFSDLASAHGLLGEDTGINRLSFALDGGLSEERYDEVMADMLDEVNRSVSAVDAGLNLTLDRPSSSITVTSAQGLGRIAADDVRALRGNMSALAPGGLAVEVLQVPLVEVTVNGQPLLTLADGSVTELHATNTSVWHVGPGGFGVEVLNNASTWAWQVPTGGRLLDVALDASGERALAVHADGLVLADTHHLDEEAAAVVDASFHQAAAWHTDGWVVVVADDDDWTVEVLEPNLTKRSVHELAVDLPSTVLSVELLTSGADVMLGVEGLFGTQWYTLDLTPTGALASATDDPRSSEPPMSLPAPCNGAVGVMAATGERWCTVDGGLAVLNSTNTTVGLRLPLQSDAPGFGTFPQMLLAFGTNETSGNITTGDVRLSPRLDSLNLSTEDALRFTGLIPYAYGDDASSPLHAAGTYATLPGFEALSELEGLVLGVVALDDAEQLALADSDERSLIVLRLSNASVVSPEDALAQWSAWFDDLSGADDMSLSLTAVKRDAALQAEASSGVLSAMFLVFGSFTIAAGVLLSLTIIMLLADVRRKETAVVRAIGLQRSEARALFVQEGLMLALLAGGIGALLGLGLAWLVASGFASIFASVGAQRFVFDFTLDSVVAGWVWGTLIAWVMLVASAGFNAQLNIVQALRGAPLRFVRTVPWWLMLLQVVGFGGAVLGVALLVVLGLGSSAAYALYIGSGALLLLALMPVFTWMLPTWRYRRSTTLHRSVRYAPRTTLGALGLGFLMWTMVLAPVDPIRSRMEPNELAFIVLGLTQVVAGVMVLTSFAPLLVQRLSKQGWLMRRTGPVGSVALAHPLAAPWRSAVVMAMFSITMFSVVVLSGYTAQFDTYSTGFVEEAEGEFELMIASSRARPIDVSDDPDSWGIDPSLSEQVDGTGRVARATAWMEDADGERMPYVLRGVDDGFVRHGGLPLHAWDEVLGDTSEEAWMSIQRFPDVVFLDASFGLENSVEGGGLVPLQFSIGDSILLIDISNPQNNRSVTVGGFLAQSSYLFSPGVWMAEDPVVDRFGGEVTRMYVSISDDARPIAPSFANVEVSGQGKTTEVRQATLELEAALDEAFSSEGVVVDTVVAEVMVVQGLVLAILALFEGYLALGLVVGVAGIGVVTVRNVSERTREVGMLRALGFQRSHVAGVFLIEISWLAGVGLLNGLVTGYAFHRMLHEAVWSEQGAPFLFPWGEVVGLLFACWAVVLLATFTPVRRAARVPPSAALRTV